MGSQFNSEFTLSSRFCSYLSRNDVTSLSISPPVLRRSLLWPLTLWGHTPLEADRRLTFPLSRCVCNASIVTCAFVCVPKGRGKVPEQLYEHTAAQMNGGEPTVIWEHIVNTCSCRQHIHSAHSGHSDSVFEGVLRVAGLVITFGSRASLLEQRVEHREVNSLLVSEVLWVIFAHTH